MQLLWHVISSVQEVARGSRTQQLENPHRNKVPNEHCFIQLGIVNVQRLAKFELINQFIHEPHRYREIVLPVKVVFLVEHIVHEDVVFPQEAFE